MSQESVSREPVSHLQVAAGSAGAGAVVSESAGGRVTAGCGTVGGQTAVTLLARLHKPVTAHGGR